MTTEESGLIEYAESQLQVCIVSMSAWGRFIKCIFSFIFQFNRIHDLNYQMVFFEKRNVAVFKWCFFSNGEVLKTVHVL